jgi:diguanylate cyclase (GGDEF)-like protein
VVGKDVMAATKELYASQDRVTKLRFATVDYGQVQKAEISQSELQQIVALNLAASKITHTAVVATITSTQFVTTLVQQWQALVQATGWEMKTFLRRDEAWRWVQQRVYDEFSITLDRSDLPADIMDDYLDTDIEFDPDLTHKWQELFHLLEVITPGTHNVPQDQALKELENRLRDIYESHTLLAKDHQALSGHLLELSRMHIELAKRARTDQLTGLLNRWTFIPLVEAELARQSRWGLEVCFCICDIDHFKKINDTYGHSVGDVVLRSLAQRMKGELRKYDVIWRWGGEEFLMMWPDTTLEMGAAIAERLRNIIAHKPFVVNGHSINLTMSFGLTTIVDGEDINVCLDRCDGYLYMAKHAGRNRVVSGNSSH